MVEVNFVPSRLASFTAKCVDVSNLNEGLYHTKISPFEGALKTTRTLALCKEPGSSYSIAVLFRGKMTLPTEAFVSQRADLE